MSLLNIYTLANNETSYYAVAGSGIPIPGPPGPTGPAGPIGPTGLSVLSDVNPPAAGTGVPGDLFVDLVTSQLYKKTGPATWTPEFAMIGPAGAAGTAATITVASTSTLPAGQPANVQNVGTAQDAILNFAIPEGPTGATGPQGPPGSAADAALWSTFPATQVVDLNNNAVANAVLIDAPIGLQLTANGGDIVLLQKNPGSSIILDGPIDICGNDLLDVGNVTTSGAGKSIFLGGLVPPSAPLAQFGVLSSEVSISHLNPLSQMLVKGLGDVRVESTNGDLNLIGDDVNIAATGVTNVLNLTAPGGIQSTSAGFFNVTAGGGMGIQAGGLISITTPGQINIGSGNTLGATTSIEKLDILDSVVSKVAGADDLEFENVKKISNAGDVTRALLIEASDAPLTLQGVQTNLTSLSNGNVVIAPQGTGTTRIGTGSTADVVVIDATGLATFSVAPQTAAVPAVGNALTNKTYVDTGLSTRLPNNANISLNFNIAAPAASAATNGPFLYVPSAAGPPTGTPVDISGCVPLYVETGGTAKLWTYFSGVWTPI